MSGQPKFVGLDQNFKQHGFKLPQNYLLVGFSTNRDLKTARNRSNYQIRDRQQLANLNNPYCLSILMLQKEYLQVKKTKPNRPNASLIVGCNPRPWTQSKINNSLKSCHFTKNSELKGFCLPPIYFQNR